MKNKASLSLIEITIMVLVFAAAAAMCMRAFVWSARRTGENRDIARAAICCQNYAEEVKYARHAEKASELFDRDWNNVEKDGAFELMCEPFCDGFLGGADVTVRTAAGKTLFSVRVCWQEAVS